MPAERHTVTTVLEPGFVALAVTLAVAPLALALLRRGNVLDHPCERSSHGAPVPRGGGLAPGMGALVGLAFTSSLDGGYQAGIGVASVAFGLVGLLEDVVGIPALRRLAIQFVAAAVAAPFLLEDLSGPVLWRAVFAVAVVFWLVAVTNAYNFMDGIDGISVAQATGAGATWFFVGTHGDSAALAAGGAIVAGAALGFAPYNVPRARVFLGDVGSYFIGAWLAAVAVLGLRAAVPAEAVLAPLALYLADTGVTLGRRIARGERWYLPHREHVYQRLGNAGWSHVRASAFVAVCIGACGALGALSLGDSVPARVAADVAIVGVIAAYLLAPKWLARSDAAAPVR
jgi:UDP-GlcNAc:undecaprenyl-phosphate GlcNAc-1-phosphate transferase